MEQTSEEEVKTTGKVARTLKRRMATALTRDSASDLRRRGDCAMRTWPTLREGRSEDRSTSLVARKDGSHNAPSHQSVSSPKVRIEA